MAALGFASGVEAQVQLISGYNFGQFIGDGPPSLNGSTFDFVGSIGANYSGTSIPPASSSGDFVGNNGLAGNYSNNSGRIYWDGTNGSSSYNFSNGIDIVAQATGPNAVNGSTVGGNTLAFSGDGIGLGLTSQIAGNKIAFVQVTTGFLDFNPDDYVNGPNVVSDANLTFAGSVTAPVTVSWFLGTSSTPFATTSVSGSTMASYSVDLPPDFYNKTSSTVLAQFSGTITIDNVQINGITSAGSGGGAATFWKNGDGIWTTATTPTNWRDAAGTAQAAWTAGPATFRGTAGTVTVDNAGGQVVFTGATFSTTGYTVAGGALQTNTAVTPIQVGDTTPATATVNATITAPITGTGGLNKTGQGTLTLGGNNTYTGNTTVAAGTLLVNGDSAGATGPTSVASGARLGGTGTLGTVTVQNSGILLGQTGSTLTLGNVTLSPSSFVNITLGAPSTTELFKVNGGLTLDGTLNVTGATGFGAGLYRVFNYTGNLTDNTLTAGTVPAGVISEIQTSVANQVNVVFIANTGGNNTDGNNTGGNNTGGNNTGGGGGLRPMWSGGAGTWTAAANSTSWKSVDGTTSGAWMPGMAIFQGTPGTVTVENTAGAVGFTGLQVANDGYTIAGGTLTTTTSHTALRVGDGTSAGSSMTGTISSTIAGSGGVEKTDLGTLVLSGNNTYGGGTTVVAGALQVGAGGTSGSISGNVTNNAALVLNRSDAVTFAGSIRGTGNLTHAGSGTTSLTGTNTYTGGTTIATGTLQIGAGGTTGSVTGNIVNNAVLNFNRSDAMVLSGAISGPGSVTQTGPGTTSLTGANTYTGGTTISAGTLQIGSGGTTGSITGNVTNAGTLGFNRSDAIAFDGVIGGTGAVVHNGRGTTTLSANNTYTGATTINAGTLRINGNQTAPTGALTVAAGGALGGTGTTGGAVSVQNGGTISAASAGLFTVGGLALGSAAQTNLALGAPSATKLLQVNGALTLDGLYNISNAGGLALGTYRIADYTGTLTDNTLQFGSAPVNPGDLVLSTATANQVNLTFAATVSDYWKRAADGTGGGTGTWAATGGTDWTNFSGTAAGAWLSRTATFGGTAGTVTVDNTAGAVTLTGAQFTTTGYTLAGGNLTTTTAGTLLQVGDGSTAGAASTATVSAAIIGTGGINKTDLGTLILSGNNTYGGNTTVSAGTLTINGTQTAATGNVTINSGARLGGTGSSASVMVQNGGTLVGASGSAFTMTGLTLSPNSRISASLGAQSTAGLFQVNGALTLDGTLDIINAGAFGPGSYRLFSYTGSFIDNGLLLGSNPTSALIPVIQTSVANQVNLLVSVAPLPIWTAGSGTWSAAANGASWGAVDGTYMGAWQPGMAIFQGAPGTVTVDTSAGPVVVTGVQLASDGYTLTGSAITTNTANTVIRVGDGTSAGETMNGTIASAIVGTGGVEKNDLGTLILSGDSTYTGGTTIAAGTLQIGAGGTTGSVVGNIANNAALSFNRSATLTVSGVIGGTGSVAQIGAGTTVLSAINTYTGGTTITAGTLQIGAGGTTGSIAGGVTNNGTLSFNRSDTVTFASAISGSGAVTQIGTGVTTLTGNNTYTGTTTVSSGTLQIGAGGTVGSITGNVVNNAMLSFNRSDTVTFASAISGSGSVTQMGTGVTALTGSNTYTGTTFVSSGTLQIGAGGTTGSIAGNVVNNGTLAINRSNAITLAGSMSGTGSLVQQGGGITTLTGNNTPGGGTTIDAGTLQIGGGGTSGSLAGNIVNQSVLGVNRSDAITLSGTIGGTGALSQLGTGTTTLAANNTYTGGTTIAAGTLQLGAGGTSGAVLGDIVNNGALAINRSDSVSIGGVISGSGTLTQSGSGTAVLTATNLYSGGTTIASGTLQLGAGGTSGSVSGNIANNATLAINRSDALTIEGVVSGTGSLRHLGTGTTTVTGANLHAGGTSIAAGTLQIGAGGTAGSITGNVVNHATLAINRSDAYAVGGVVSGSGALVQAGAGTTTLVATNTYTGGTMINAGTLRIGSGGTTGSVAGNIVNNGTLAIDRSDATSMSNIISGSGSVVKQGSGTLTLTGANLYSGGTSVNAGVLEISDNASLGAPSGGLTLNGGTLRTPASLTTARNVNIASAGGTLDTGANSLVLQGIISGTGNLTKTGTGVLTVSGSNTHTGLTALSQGTIVLQGGSLGSTTVAANARLGGTGTIRGSLTNSGTITPGNSTGTLNVTGNYSQTATGSLGVELASTIAFDQLVVTGTANLGGTLTVVGLAGFTPDAGQTFKIIDAAGGINGTFAAVVSPWSNVSPMLRFEALYGAKDVKLSMTQLPFGGIVGSAGRGALGKGIDGAIASGSIPNLQRALNALPSINKVREALAELSPQSYDRWFDQSVYSAGATLRTIENRLEQVLREPRGGLWMEIVRREADFDATPELSEASASASGIMVGGDARVLSDLQLGLVFGYTDETLSLDESGSSTEANRITGSLYARYDLAPLFVEAVAGGTNANLESRRVVAIPGYAGVAESTTKSNDLYGSLRLGYTFVAGRARLTPYAGAHYVNWSAATINESGAREANLKIHAQSRSSLASRAGLMIAFPFMAEEVSFIPRLDLAWRHEFRSGRGTLMGEIGGSPFSLQGSALPTGGLNAILGDAYEKPDDDGIVAGVGFDVTFGARLTAYLRVSGEWSAAASKAIEARAGTELRF